MDVRWPGDCDRRLKRFSGFVSTRYTLLDLPKMVFVRGLFHLGCGIFYIYGTYYDMQIVSDHLSSYGGRSKYLTFLNLVSFLSHTG